ncbi:hypothetical protein EDD36DRAFT_420847 [Exophiala viscosa]|uniref:DUF1989 domain-containing protein n=1 Tax=Exophiala viscosa TaxID=2486360 RepID=A0AAN6DTB1_9EURO|nr:hypothetical protein EDD36DRAFT_420847 [Exophiala viscosa]
MSPYAPGTKNTIPARSSAAAPLKAGQSITVINTHGTQVIDFWAFTLPTTGSKTLPTWLSMCHTRASTVHLSPLPGDTLVTSDRSPILTLMHDTTPGVHDTLMAACDKARYLQLGCPEEPNHGSCTENLHIAVERDTPYALPEYMTAPDPLNLFMNIPVVPLPEGKGRAPNNVSAGAELRFESPVCEEGGSVTLKALVDCVAVMSACPQDILKVNNNNPTEAHFIVE